MDSNLWLDSNYNSLLKLQKQWCHAGPLLYIYTSKRLSAVECGLVLSENCFFYVFYLSFFIAGNEAKGFWTPAQHVNLSAISEQFPSGAIQNV